MIRLAALSMTVLLAGTAVAAAVTVDNPKTAPRHDTVTLTEAFRVGGDDDESVLLGQVASAAVGPQGRLYVLDTQLAHVLVLDDEGRLQATLGREGDGPGEMRRPIGVDVRDDGTVAVVQAFPGKIIYLAPDGTPAGTFELGGDDPAKGGLAVLQEASERAGELVVSGFHSAFRPGDGEMNEEHFLAAVNPSGGEIHRFATVEVARNLRQLHVDDLAEYFGGDRGKWSLAPDGHLYCATSYQRYEITRYTPDGDVDLVITRDHAPRTRTASDKEELRGGMRMNINGQEPEITYDLQDHDPCIGSLAALDDGTLWVENSHARDRWDDEGVVTYDVYGSDGKLQRDVTVTVPQGGEGNRLIHLRDGRFVLVRGQDRLMVSVSAGDGDDDGGSSSASGSDVPLEVVVFAAPGT